MEIVTPSHVWEWVERLRTLTPLREHWGSEVIAKNTPGADKADEALVIQSDAGEILGAVLLAPGYLIGVFVLNSSQKNGYGGLLMETAIHHLLQRGAESIFIEVCDQRALRIIERLPADIRARLDVRNVMRDE